MRKILTIYTGKCISAKPLTSDWHLPRFRNTYFHLLRWTFLGRGTYCILKNEYTTEKSLLNLFPGNEELGRS